MHAEVSHLICLEYYRAYTTLRQCNHLTILSYYTQPHCTKDKEIHGQSKNVSKWKTRKMEC